MDKLDLNKLHTPITTGGRGQGRTVKMVAELMGNVDISENNELHIVFIPNGRPRHYMMSTIADVANAMNIEIAKSSHNSFLFKNGASVRVLNIEEKGRLEGYKYREFFD